MSDNDQIDIELFEQELIERRQNHQRKMAWVAMISMIVFTAALFSPIVPESRLSVLVDIATMFYLAQAGVVGAYMGAEALVNRTRNELGKSKTLQQQKQSPKVGR